MTKCLVPRVEPVDHLPKVTSGELIGILLANTFQQFFVSHPLLLVTQLLLGFRFAFKAFRYQFVNFLGDAVLKEGSTNSLPRPNKMHPVL